MPSRFEMGSTPTEHRKAIVGNLDHDFWVFDSEGGFDLTRPSPPASGPRSGSVSFITTTSAVTIDPAKTALVVIDMQNFFLSPALGRSPRSKGLQAQEQLLQHALPAARKAGIQIVWLNWGLCDEDLVVLPPAVVRAFGITTLPLSEFEKQHSATTGVAPASAEEMLPAADQLGKDTHIYKGIGNALGDVTIPGVGTIAAGRMLMRDQWNTRLTPALQESYEASLKTLRPDVWIDKLRMSGLHVPDTAANRYFRQNNIKTLLFTGVNTDQCVGGTLVDAFAQGYDCIMLSDGCATSSPPSAQECWEYNGAKTFGFVVDCKGFADGVEASLLR